jgi:hypothetical protein
VVDYLQDLVQTVFLVVHLDIMQVAAEVVFMEEALVVLEVLVVVLLEK